MNSTHSERVIEILQQTGILRPRDLTAYGIPRSLLGSLHKDGLVRRVGRGLYMLPEAVTSEHHSLAEACKRVPKSVVCLLSALRFHGLTTQAPFEVWLAIAHKARRPQLDYPPLRIVRFSGLALEAGVAEYSIEGVPVRVYDPAKTVADCFKFRNKIGLDVALEALRDCRRQRLCTSDELWRYAEVCRVAKVMKPYLEATA